MQRDLARDGDATRIGAQIKTAGGEFERLGKGLATIEQAVRALGLDRLAFEGSDSLDNPEAVFQ